MRIQLLAGSALAALACATAASAQSAAPTSAAAAVDAAAATDAELGAVIVYSQGQSRQVQTIKAVEMAAAAPGTSAIKLVEKLPGVNFQSADAFGAYEWSTRISIRGFNQNQIGFTLDGAPLGDMSYGNFNGLHISRAIASEDIGAIELAQGAGSLETASTANLGGTLKFVSRDPSDAFHVYAQGTAGSNSMYRGFVRLDTGVLPTGGRAYLSYANQNTDKWKGDGEQKQQQIDFKAVQPIGDFTLSGFLDWSRRRENDYQDLSLGMIDRFGYDWDNNSGDWAQAVAIADIGNNRGDSGSGIISNAAAGKVYPAPFTSLDDAYFNAAGLRNDTLWALSLAAPKSDRFEAKGTVYGHKNAGQGLWYTPYTPSPNVITPGATTDNAPISIRTTEYNIDRKGFIFDATAYAGQHAISFGGWYEDNDFDQARRFYALNRAAPQRDSLKFQSNPFLTQWAYTYNTKTKQAYLQDVWTVSEAFKINFGFKAVKVDSDSQTVVGAPVINGRITSQDGFLPQVGATYRINGDNELFAGYTENMRAFGAAHTGLSPFATTQAGFDATKDTLKPETSKTVELGYRMRSGGFQGVAAVYYVKFDNRLIGTTAGAGIVGNPTILANAGSVTAKGFEAAGTWQATDQLSLFASYAYNDSKYDDDILNPNGTVAQAIADKVTTDTPKHLLKGEVTWEMNGFFVKGAAHLTSKRFFTYTNDQSVPSYTLVDLSFGYKFPGDGIAKGAEIQVNVTNLFDKKYVSTIGSNGFGYSGDSMTLLAGAPRQAFVTLKKTF